MLEVGRISVCNQNNLNRCKERRKAPSKPQGQPEWNMLLQGRTVTVQIYVDTVCYVFLRAFLSHCFLWLSQPPYTVRIITILVLEVKTKRNRKTWCLSTMEKLWQPHKRSVLKRGLKEKQAFNKQRGQREEWSRLNQELWSLEAGEGWMTLAQVVSVWGWGLGDQQGPDLKGLVCWQPLWLQRHSGNFN